MNFNTWMETAEAKATYLLLVNKHVLLPNLVREVMREAFDAGVASVTDGEHWMETELAKATHK